MKFYKSVKFKVLAGALLLIIILCAAFIRIIPDYSTSRGFAVVSVFGYYKYKKGYCLAEKRILDKEEFYRRAIVQFLDKKLIYEQKMDKARIYAYGSSMKSKIKIGYYELADDINLDNWLEKTINYYKDLYSLIKDDEYKSDLDEKARNILLFDKLKIKKTNPIKYLKIDLNRMVAGFDKPIFLANNGWSGIIILDNAIILRDKKIAYGYNFILHYNFYDSSARNMILDKKMFNSEIRQSKYSYPRLNIGDIDNCGNLDYDVSYNPEDIANSLGKGG